MESGADSGFPIGGANAVGGRGGASQLIHQWEWHSGAYHSNVFTVNIGGNIIWFLYVKCTGAQ